MKSKLRAISPEVLEHLRENVEQNLDLYLSGDFKAASAQNGWEIEVSIEFDPTTISGLNGGGEKNNPGVAVSNSTIIWNALSGLSPNLAAEERIWTRLTHIEGLTYSRSRWLSGLTSKEERLNAINKHFFAKGVNGIRDDNAISRLWWNAQVAKIAMPDNIESALALILKTTDYRLNLVERPGMNSRQPIAAAVLRSLASDEWLGTEKNFRAFQRAINRFGGGMMHEIMTPTEVDGFMQHCIDAAKLEMKHA